MRMFTSLIASAVFIGSTAAQPPARTVLVIHGGAGVLTDKEMIASGVTRKDFEQALAKALSSGYLALQEKGKTSVDAVEASIRIMEDSGLFNAGRGAVFNADGRVELDAAMMEGRMTGSGEGKGDPRKRAGAITGVTHVRNPISAARAIMEMGGARPVLLAGTGAEAVVFDDPLREKYRIERVSNVYFWSDRRLRQIRETIGKDAQRVGQAGGADRRFGTVGAVAVDAQKNLAAGTSTGGLSNKLPGRVGDAPVIGGGTYADDRACGVSCTGTGEVFIRHAVAHDVVARMVYAKASITEAVRETISELPDEEGGVGGLIALDKDGRHAFGISKKSDGMFRGYATQDGKMYVALYADEKEKIVTVEAEKNK